MTNLDFWNTFVGEENPESFMRNYGSADPELCVRRFIEERGQLYGVVNQGSWVNTFTAAEQHHSPTVRVYLLSYLEDTRDNWQPALEANPPHIPRRYREKFDTERYPPPGSAEDSPQEEAGTYGTYIPGPDDDLLGDNLGLLDVPVSGEPSDAPITSAATDTVPDDSLEIPGEEMEPALTESCSREPDVIVPEDDATFDEPAVEHPKPD